MIEMNTLTDILKTWALPQFRDAQKQFAKNPNALNWNQSLRSMLTLQQLEFAARSNTIDQGKLMFDLESNPIGQWQDVICRATTNMTCAQTLREAAVVTL